MAGIGRADAVERSGRVLLVDGRPARRELTELALTFVGYAVAVAEDATVAADVFEQFVPGLVISSVDTERDGVMEVHQRLLRLGDATPQLLLASESVFAALVARQVERGFESSWPPSRCRYSSMPSTRYSTRMVVVRRR